MKLYDLAPDEKMTPIIGLLHSTVNYNFLRLKRLLEGGMTQEEIDFKGESNELNSIAQLLRHLTVVDLHWVYRLQSTPVPFEYQERLGVMYDDEGKLPMIKGVSLKTLIDQYEEIQAMFHDVFLNKTDNDLSQEVPFENGNTATIRWAIWHIADHSRHHYANIVQLKKLVRG